MSESDGQKRLKNLHQLNFYKNKKDWKTAQDKKREIEKKAEKVEEDSAQPEPGPSTAEPSREIPETVKPEMNQDRAMYSEESNAEGDEIRIRGSATDVDSPMPNSDAVSNDASSDHLQSPTTQTEGTTRPPSPRPGYSTLPMRGSASDMDSPMPNSDAVSNDASSDHLQSPTTQTEGTTRLLQPCPGYYTPPTRRYAMAVDSPMPDSDAVSDDAPNGHLQTPTNQTQGTMRLLQPRPGYYTPPIRGSDVDSPMPNSDASSDLLQTHAIWTQGTTRPLTPFHGNYAPSRRGYRFTLNSPWHVDSGAEADISSLLSPSTPELLRFIQRRNSYAYNVPAPWVFRGYQTGSYYPRPDHVGGRSANPPCSVHPDYEISWRDGCAICSWMASQSQTWRRPSPVLMREWDHTIEGPIVEEAPEDRQISELQNSFYLQPRTLHFTSSSDDERNGNKFNIKDLVDNVELRPRIPQERGSGVGSRDHNEAGPSQGHSPGSYNTSSSYRHLLCNSPDESGEFMDEARNAHNSTMFHEYDPTRPVYPDEVILASSFIQDLNSWSLQGGRGRGRRPREQREQ